MDARSLNTRALNINDLRELSRRRLPKILFEFLDRGAEDDIGVRRNREALDKVAIVPRILRDVSRANLGASLFGQPATLPIGISATGGANMFWPDGDVVLAQAAKAAGVPFMISGAALTDLEEITAVGGRLWYQYYPGRDRAFCLDIVDQAQALGCEALVATVDTANVGNREYNQHNGFTWPIQFNLTAGLDVARRPGWAWNVLAYNLRKGGKMSHDARRVLDAENFTWDDIKDLRRRWRGPLLLKGVLSPVDARRAVELGCDGVIVSNHGGRNLDPSMASIDALPAVAEAIGGRAKVLFDSGVRRGTDVFKALALGADFAMVGRATLYGMSVAGEPGVRRALDLLAQELRRTMVQSGAANLEDITADLIAGAAQPTPRVAAA